MESVTELTWLTAPNIFPTLLDTLDIFTRMWAHEQGQSAIHDVRSSARVMAMHYSVRLGSSPSARENSEGKAGKMFFFFETAPRTLLQLVSV